MKKIEDLNFVLQTQNEVVEPKLYNVVLEKVSKL